MQQPLSRENMYIFDPESGAEMARLIDQDRFTTQGMGGTLVGLPELPAQARVLDLACGPGGWVLDVAYEHPDFEVCGVDISGPMINYANARAASQGLSNASFGVMDITQPLDIDDHSLDLVNARFLTGVLKRDTWKPFIVECTRILRPGGILRLTEGNEFGVTISPAVEQLTTLILQATWRAGYGFSPNGRTWGMSAGLPYLLRQVGYWDLHVLSHVADFSAATERWADYYHNYEIIFSQMKSLLLAQRLLTDEAFEQVYQQALVEMRAIDFSCVAQGITVWAYAPE